MKKISGNRKAVLFDMDGVLIDSEIGYLNKIYAQVVQRYDFLKREDLYPTVGMDGESERLFMHRITGEPMDNKAFDVYLEGVHSNIRMDNYRDILNPGVVETLEFLKKRNYKTALASSSSMQVIKKVLRQCGIGPFFDFVVSGEQFKESKPNPEIYLTVMKALGCTPDECIVVEDSNYGIEAGLLAGAYVIAKRDDRFNMDQSKADDHIDRIDEVMDLL